ncbi:TRAP transporter substrate-binding protein [Rhodobium gokarnense]|uniref:TRAP-type C4-dicarboxylate transport system substrate-binding protein n=1 Tax=Rhodobium gokarnense TaxID=364296 RepID=A0ABT3HIH6_9HYPH|nr:TRAP transporter substrate-binding protein DctP [Rhodobium gokarnense]MCW2310208.1 TRAP-type C4-dicarboxylate transport system substrate-binding protein [Rhodobium gokarnense]
MLTASEKLKGISRRDILRLTKQFGITSTLVAAGGLTGTVTLSRLAEAANSTYEKRFKTPAKHTWKFGAAGFNERNLLIERAGCLEFVRDIEERSDGAIRIEFIGSNQMCGQLDCVKKTQQGITDVFSASTQNSAGGAPYLNVLDYAYMFPTRASQYYFFYHPGSEKVLREPLRKRHGLQFLFTHCELRGIQLGLKWKDKPLVKSVKDLAGTKNRVTGTQLGRIAMELMELNPTPIAWEETLDGLKQGLIDGAETWAAAVAYANMSPVVSQCVNLGFFCGTEHTSMSASKFDELSGDLQDAVMESAYLTQVQIQAANEAALVNTVGFSDPQLPDTLFAKNNVRVAMLDDAARHEAEQMCSPEFKPEPWEKWRERLNDWSGGMDTYKTIYDIAREIPADTKPENVEPRRWWKG